ncbi:hypothetical protein [Desulfobulbus alkaliphilus]|uniref:hypothetical protein n=1 Tax=Desulfobulbus alkaliphilus TaxID=869814 RepID=UPI0019662654|nr:hypothetical protein [Desulfobulbus alkaliphilus]MBM9536191.1 hypothetical protein [Desulfobulbus alkaliphilus]
MPVIFQPWIGNLYRANNRFGVRVLVLGESHYGDEAETRPTVTTEVVRRLAQGERHSFFTKVSKVLLGLDRNTWLNNEARGEVWEHISFYNYIQGFVSTDPRVRPTADMWESAREPFLQIIRDLNPQLILVLGIELGRNIRAVSSDIEVCVIQHPSTGFSYEQWTRRFLEALERARASS